LITVTIEGSLPKIPTDYTPIMEKVSALMLGSVQEQFGEGGLPGRWRSLISGEVSWLFQTGDLLRSIGRTFGPDFAEVSTSHKTARWMQSGSHPLVTEKSIRFFWAKFYETKLGFWKGMALQKPGKRMNVPARPFMLFQSEDVTSITSLFGSELVKFINADPEVIR
jgi:phage gpG-like protein